MHAPPTTAPGMTTTESLPRLPTDRTGSAATASAPNTLTILFVDDHCNFAALLSAALNTVPGMRCVGTAATAADGIALAKNLQPNIVAIDIRLISGEDGLATTRRVKEVAPDAVVAMISAYRDPEWITRAARAGASAFIPKTGSLSDMLDMLYRIGPRQPTAAPST